MKVFEQNGYRSAKGQMVSYRNFKLFKDMPRPLEIEESKAKRIMSNAEKRLTEEVPALPASLYREFFKNGNRVNFESPYFERRNMAIYYAAAEYIEGKGRFTDKMIDAVWAIMEESTWIIPAHLYNSPIYGEATLGPVFSEEALHGIDLFSAATAGTLATVYFLCKDILNKEEPIIARKIVYTVRERCITNFLQQEFWWSGRFGNRVNNWCPWILSNILFATAIIENDNYIREQVVSKSMQYLDNFFNSYHPDGGCDEGPAYWSAAGASMFDCLELIEEMTGGKITVYDSPLVKNIGDYIYKVNINSNRYVNFADCAPKTNPLPSMLVRYGQKTGSEFLEAFGRRQAKEQVDFLYDKSQAYRSLKCIFGEKLEAGDCPMPLKTWLPDLQLMTARETCEPSQGFFIAAKGGTNDEMHNHNDIGNYMVYYNGEPVIIDTGVGVYTKQTFSPDRYKLWFMQSSYHNLPSFDGVEQSNGAQYISENVVYNEDENKLTLGLTKAYHKDAGIVNYTREISLNGDIVSINEDITLDSVKSITFHIMTSTKPIIEDDGRILLSQGCSLTYDKALDVKVEEFDPVGMNTKSAWNTDVLYRTHFTIKTDKCNLTFTVSH